MVEKRAAKVFNERVKLFAGSLDRLALATVVIGIVQPLATVGSLGWSSVLWFASGVVLHVAAQKALGLMREE